MRSIFKRAFCLHEWVRMDETYLGFKNVGAGEMWVCKKCGKVTLFPKDC
jgi:hypothetical protein